MIKEGEHVEDIAELICDVVFRREIHKPFTPYRREDWARRQVLEALKLCR
jgi:hypothetical protein